MSRAAVGDGTPELAEDDDGRVRIRLGDVVLAEYVVEPPTPAGDSPKPYLHPLRTTAGEVVTAIRPHDHTWHNGLQFTMAHLSGENFWGGRTYVRGRGYTPLDNNGTIEHVRWESLVCAAGHGELRHELAWRTAAGRRWLTEHRTLRFGDVSAGHWTLSWTSRLRNTSGHELRWGSPVTEGRDTAGYGGLFWRGPRSFVGGTVRTSDGRSAAEAMGHRAPWLAFTGQHDESLRTSTLLFADSPANPGYPTAWYVRAEPFPVVSFAATYHRPWLLEPGEELSLTHHVVVIDGAPDPARLAELAARAAD
ncbi:PmoA family protein [Amycolatopsis sp. NEAU-NG30]|uniref:PmoA family protein n=1 Tax=Amycolatopsis melonis TaxID=3156488 RepID=A0ABV0LCX0_9PSEU